MGHEPLSEQPLLLMRGELPEADGSGLLSDGVHQLRRRDLEAGGYSELLQRMEWQQFWTLTFRVEEAGRTGGVHEEKADKAFRFFASCINKQLYGSQWHKRPHRGIQWARGQEFHKDGRLHFHAVAAAPTDDLNRLMSRYEWHEFWFKEFGRNRIEAPRSQLDITGYVSKYVSKGGVVDLSKNFGAWTPPPIDYTRRPVQAEFLQSTRKGSIESLERGVGASPLRTGKRSRR